MNTRTKLRVVVRLLLLPVLLSALVVWASPSSVSAADGDEDGRCVSFMYTGSAGTSYRPAVICAYDPSAVTALEAHEGESSATGTSNIPLRRGTNLYGGDAVTGSGTHRVGDAAGTQVVEGFTVPDNYVLTILSSSVAAGYNPATWDSATPLNTHSAHTHSGTLDALGSINVGGWFGACLRHDVFDEPYAPPSTCSASWGYFDLDLYAGKTAAGGLAAFLTANLPVALDGSAPSTADCVSSGVDIEINDEPADSTTEVNNGDQVRWTIPLDEDQQIDDLWGVYEYAPTPIQNTGDYPYAINYRLGLPGGGPVPWDFNQPLRFGYDDTGSLGLSYLHLISIGDANAITVGPGELTGTFVWLANDGLVFADYFSFQCHNFGSVEADPPYGWQVLTLGDPDDLNGCDRVRAVLIGDPETDDPYKYRVTEAINTGSRHTEVLAVEWSYDGGTWFTIIEDPPAGGFREDIEIDRTTYPDPALVEFRCTSEVFGEDPVTTGVEPSPGFGVDPGVLDPTLLSEASCYEQAGMELTAPSTWIKGLGKMGVCLLEWLFVPGDEYLSEWVDERQVTLRETFPLSVGMVFVDFASDTGDALESGAAPTGGGCFNVSPITESVSPAEGESCIGAGVTISGGTRTFLTVMMLVPLFMALCANAWALLQGGPLLPSDSYYKYDGMTQVRDD